jgi:hypothetical protein
MSILNRIYGVLLLASVAGASSAAGLTFDVADATASITAGGAVIATLGVAALLISIGVKMWKRFRSAA